MELNVMEVRLGQELPYYTELSVNFDDFVFFSSSSKSSLRSTHEATEVGCGRCGSEVRKGMLEVLAACMDDFHVTLGPALV